MTTRTRVTTREYDAEGRVTRETEVEYEWPPPAGYVVDSGQWWQSPATPWWQNPVTCMTGSIQLS